MAMIVAGLCPAVRWRWCLGEECFVIDVTPWPNRTRKTFHRIVPAVPHRRPSPQAL